MKAFLIAALLTALMAADASAFGRCRHRGLFRHHTRAAVGCAAGCSSCQ